MDNIAYATLTDGRKIQYVITDNPPRGGMKYTYFSPDRSYVVQFFNDPKVGRNVNIQKRLEAIIGKYNPTLQESQGGAKGNTEQTANYFYSKYCWPTALIREPEFGIVCPAYPSNFFFDKSASDVIDLNGKDKKATWFTSKARQYLNLGEIGDFRSMLQISTTLARAVRRMHQAGLAHSDLSCNNVLIDPVTGGCVIIDIDSLVVPGLFPPEVIGTRGYIAPEVLETIEYSFDDPRRKLPSSYTDLHALAVLIYEYLMLRHPLVGPKIFSINSPEKDDYLAFGPMAVFIEHPNDLSNRPDDLNITIKDLGADLESLFLRAFVEGLHNPDARPTAMEWEKALIRTQDMLYPCENSMCAAKWFVLHDENNPVCPFCGHMVSEKINKLHMKSPLYGRTGQWKDLRAIIAYDNMPLFKWHIYANSYPDEKADRTLQAYICKNNDQWLLVNKNVAGMLSPNGNIVPRGRAILLKNGLVFMASDKDNGMLIEVSQK